MLCVVVDQIVQIGQGGLSEKFACLRKGGHRYRNILRDPESWVYHADRALQTHR